MSISIPEIDGNKVSYDIWADNFNNIYIMSTSFYYDTNRMIFLTAKNVAIPTLATTEFKGDVPGYVYFTWFDITMQGESFPNSTILYRLQFKMKDGDYGDVCFSNYPVELLFTDFDSTFHSLFVTDYCHPDTFEYVLVTHVPMISFNDDGLTVNSLSIDNELYFNLQSDKTIAFKLINMNGQIIQTFNPTFYSAGTHALQINPSLPQGLYVLKSEINQVPIVAKVIVQ